MQDASNCEVTWSFDGTTANVFYAFQYSRTIFASLNMWKGSGGNVYSFTTPSSGRTEVVGSLSAFHKQEIKRTGAGQYDLIFDNVFFNDYTTTNTGKIAVAKVMGANTSSSTDVGEKRFRVMRATFGDDVFLIPVVKGNQKGFYNTLDGQLFLADQECLSEGKEIGAPYTKEVEYLESTGTQWIDTGIYGDDNLLMSVSCMATVQSAVLRNVASALDKSHNSLFGYSFSIKIPKDTMEKYSTAPNTTPTNTYNVDSVGKWHNVAIDTTSGAKKTFIDGIQVGTTNTGTAMKMETTVYLFAGNNNNGGANFFADGVRVSAFSIKDTITDEFLLHLIPVRFLNENGQQEGAMYDKVSKQLFRNKGTGSFTIGPDKV